MDIFSNFDDSMESSTLKVAVDEKKTRELLAVRRLLKKQDLTFGTSMRTVKKKSPIFYLLAGNNVPMELRTIVLRKNASLGIKSWGHVDFLINYCDYSIQDWRKG